MGGIFAEFVICDLSMSVQSQAAPAPFEPPSVEGLNASIGDRYVILELVSVGGMGAVYKAQQPMLERVVAVKLLPPSGDEGDKLDFAERFRREAKAMAQLDHPNIISVYDFGETSDGLAYFVMEFVDGTDLHKLIYGSNLEMTHILGWFGYLCSAMEYAHSRSVVHCDLKPANIMIAKDGRVKVADFGLAHLRNRDDESELSALGTPVYGAPELGDPSKEIDERADIFSLGILLYEMLTRQVPEKGWTPPSTLNPALDGQFDNLILTCVQHDPEKRFQKVSHLTAAIANLLGRKRGSAAKKGPAKKTGPAKKGVAAKKTAPAKKAAAPTKKGPPAKKVIGPVAPSKKAVAKKAPVGAAAKKAPLAKKSGKLPAPPAPSPVETQPVSDEKKPKPGKMILILLIVLAIAALVVYFGVME